MKHGLFNKKNTLTSA